MKKYLALIKISFLNSLAYRADFFLWSTSELLDTLIFLFLWIVIYGENNVIGGFSLPETVTYLIGAGMIGNLTYTWIGYDIEQDVRSGRLNTHLLKPISYPLTRLCDSIAEKPFNILIRVLVYTIIAFFFRSYFILNQNILTWIVFFISIILAIAINHLINFCFGCVAFWTTSARGSFSILRTVSAIFSGGYAPLTFFPFWFQKLAYFLPFSYTRYFPMLIYLEKIQGRETIFNLLIQIVWLVILFVLAKFLWKKGRAKYEGVGG